MPKKLVVAPSQQDLETLKELAQNTAENHRVVERARIVLACLNRQPLHEISDQFRASRSMIFRWRARFLQEGIAGLWDKPRTGKPPRYDDAFEKQVLDALALPPPADLPHWDGQSLAAYLGSSDDAIWRVLRRHGIALARKRVWSVKTQLHMDGAASQLAGLFISPPVWMMALRNPQDPPDEAQVYTRNREAGRALLQAAGKNQQLNLQQALSIMKNFPQQTTANKRREEMLNFLNDVLEATLPGQQLSILVMNPSTPLEISSWMAAHQQVKFQFYENADAVNNHLEFYLPTLSEDYTAFIKQVMAYPHAAAPFIWKTIRRDWMDEKQKE